VNHPSLFTNACALFSANLSSALGSCRSPWPPCRDVRCGMSSARTLPVEPVQSMHAKPSSSLCMRGTLRIRSTGSSPSRNIDPCFLDFPSRELGVGSGITPYGSLRLQRRKVCVVSLWRCMQQLDHAFLGPDEISKKYR
jgi:hypothetical protein